MNQETEKPKSVTFTMLLSLVFIHLQLSGEINWSWWYVLMPLYGGIILKAIIATASDYQKKRLVKLDDQMSDLCRKMGLSEKDITEMKSKLPPI